VTPSGSLASVVLAGGTAGNSSVASFTASGSAALAASQSSNLASIALGSGVTTSPAAGSAFVVLQTTSGMTFSVGGTSAFGTVFYFGNCGGGSGAYVCSFATVSGPVPANTAPVAFTNSPVYLVVSATSQAVVTYTLASDSAINANAPFTLACSGTTILTATGTLASGAATSGSIATSGDTGAIAFPAITFVALNVSTVSLSSYTVTSTGVTSTFGAKAGTAVAAGSSNTVTIRYPQGVTPSGSLASVVLGGGTAGNSAVASFTASGSAALTNSQSSQSSTATIAFGSGVTTKPVEGSAFVVLQTTSGMTFSVGGTSAFGTVFYFGNCTGSSGAYVCPFSTTSGGSANTATVAYNNTPVYLAVSATSRAVVTYTLASDSAISAAAAFTLACSGTTILTAAGTLASDIFYSGSIATSVDPRAIAFPAITLLTKAAATPSASHSFAVLPNVLSLAALLMALAM